MTTTNVTHIRSRLEARLLLAGFVKSPINDCNWEARNVRVTLVSTRAIFQFAKWRGSFVEGEDRRFEWWAGLSWVFLEAILQEAQEWAYKCPASIEALDTQNKALEENGVLPPPQVVCGRCNSMAGPCECGDCE